MRKASQKVSSLTMPRMANSIEADFDYALTNHFDHGEWRVRFPENCNECKDLSLSFGSAEQSLGANSS